MCIDVQNEATTIVKLTYDGSTKAKFGDRIFPQFLIVSFKAVAPVSMCHETFYKHGDGNDSEL